MAWFKVDDGFYTSLKFLSIPRPLQAQAAGVWLLAGTWSADKMTDGFVPYAVTELWEFDTDVIEELVKCGLWDHDEEREGIWFHDWSDYQPMREQLEAKSAARHERSVNAANARWNKPDAKPMLTDAKPMLTDAPEPVPEPVLKPLAITSPEFETWWTEYPKKVAKPAALKAWKGAISKTSIEVLLDSVKAYAAKNANTEQTYIANPATWLNQERWNDEPEVPKMSESEWHEHLWRTPQPKFGEARYE